MPNFPTLTFRRAALSRGRGDDQDVVDDVLASLPSRFRGVGEALSRLGSCDVDVIAACAVVGRDVARDGAALGEALSGLRATYAVVLGTDPEFDATQALSVAWSDATLEYLHALSCEDPLTGLASLAHVRTRLDEIYREAELTDSAVASSHALVIVELCFREPPEAIGHHFTRALRLVQVTEAMRAVYSGGQTIGRAGLDRAMALVPRTVDLGTSVALLREFLGDLDLGEARTRVWIEGLPPTAESAARLLDDLAR